MRARRPTDETGTGVYDPERPRVANAVAPPSWDHDTTEVSSRPAAAVEQPTPTEIDAELPEPIRVISMKDRGAARGPRPDDGRVALHVQLRSMAEVAGHREPQLGLGHLAPPRDPRQARRRRQRSNALWACVAVALALGISLGIWLIAGR